MTADPAGLLLTASTPPGFLTPLPASRGLLGFLEVAAVWSLFAVVSRWVAAHPVVRPALRRVLKPLSRLLVGLLAVPLFRLLMRGVKWQHVDSEVEKDLEEWFAASCLLLLCTANVEQLLFQKLGFDPGDWLSLGFRLLLAVGVVESMPDAALFPILYPGPETPPLSAFGRGKPWWGLKAVAWPYIKGTLHRHLYRSSPVLAILACIVGGTVDAGGGIPPEARDEWTAGWCCYGAAITQYLVMGLMASPEGAAGVLAKFDAHTARRRAELAEELERENVLLHGTHAPPPGPARPTFGEASIPAPVLPAVAVVASPPAPTPATRPVARYAGASASPSPSSSPGPPDRAAYRAARAGGGEPDRGR